MAVFPQWAAAVIDGDISGEDQALGGAVTIEVGIGSAAVRPVDGLGEADSFGVDGRRIEVGGGW